MSSFKENLGVLLNMFEELDVTDYTLVKERLEKISREYLRGLKHSSQAVYSRGKKSAINRFNKNERI